jgi:hypothetical protein
MALYGLRGVGKTVLINRMFRIAENRNWYCALIEATQGKSLREQIASAFDDVIRKIAKPNAKYKVIKAIKTLLNFKASLGILGNYSLGIDLGNEPGEFVSTGMIENDILVLIETLIDAAEEENVGVCLLIDETQELTKEEIAAVSYISHRETQRERKFTCALTGLPTLPSILSDAKSYAERLYSYHLIDRLSRTDAITAIVEPASSEEVTWEEQAVNKIIEYSNGYPYFIQEFSANAWDKAAGPDKIELADVENSYDIALHALDLGFYKSRWDRATDGQKRYLIAMSEDNDQVSLTSDLASRLKLKQQSLSPYRDELIHKGLIYSPNHGEVAFTVPQMSQFVKRQELYIKPFS